MRKSGLKLSIAIVLLCTSLAAQAQVINVAAGAMQGSVTLTTNTMTVRQALKAIADQAGMAVVYNGGNPALERRVNVNLRGSALTDALAVVLHGTGYRAAIGNDGQTIIVAKTETSAHKAEGVITGKVIDSKIGKGISGANVSAGNGTHGVVTDENGSYRITGISNGTYTVTVRLVGYAKQTKSVTVGEGVTITVDFKLEPSASVLDQVIVTGTVVQSELRTVPNAVTVITAKDIEQRGITRIDQLFRGDIPGLFSMNMGSSATFDQVSMFSRGASALSTTSAGIDGSTQVLSNPIKTYIDGIEMADSKYLSQIDPSSIERIEILTGPQASTIYGANAINGIMHIFTKRGTGSKPQLLLNLTSGVAENNYSSHLASDHLLNASISGVEGRLSYNVGGSWNYLGAWSPGKQVQRLNYNGGGRIQFRILNIDLSARQGLTQNRVNGSTSQGQIELNTAGVYLITPGSGLPPRRQNFTVNGNTLGLSLGYRPLPWWSHELALGSDTQATENFLVKPVFSRVNDTTLSTSPLITSRISQSYNTTMQIPVASLARLNITLGGDHWRTKGSSAFLNPLLLVGLMSGNAISNCCSRTKPDKNSGAFIQGQLGIFDALFFTYGIRTDWSPSFGEKAKVRPGRYGLAIARDVGSVSVKLRGSYGRSIRPPTNFAKLSSPTTNTTLVDKFGAFDQQLANPYLTPENRQGGEGGIELYIGNRGSLVVTRYNETTNDLISLVPRVDSVPSLLPAAPNTTNCQSINGVFTFDADGHCFWYQNQNLNVGSIRNQGWELQSSVTIGPLTSRGTYSWVKSRVLGITPRYKALLTSLAFEPGRPFDFVPEHTWALGFTYARSSNMVSLSINGTGMRYIKDDALSLAASSSNRFDSNRPRMDLNTFAALGPITHRPIGSGYATADVNASHRFSKRSDLSLQVINLTNYYQNDFSPIHASIGRQTKLGLRLKLQ